MGKNIFEFIEKEETVSLLQNMIRFNTVNEPGNEKPLAEFISEIFNSLEIENCVDDLGNNRANVIAKIRGRGESSSLLLNGHLDTVPIGDVNWDYGAFSGEILNERIYGRGSADMKGGLAAMIIAFNAAKKAGLDLKGDLVFSATAGEEVDSIGAIKFVEDGNLDDLGAIIIGEPTSNEIKVAEKGALWIEITNYGKTAHGAFPEEGVNAIVHMNHLLNKISNYKLIDTKNDLLTPPTLNISTIKGGIKTNVVPDKCSMTLDIRTAPGMDHKKIIEDFKEMIDELSFELDEFRADVKIINNRPAVETNLENEFVKLAYKTNIDILGNDKSPGGVNFYTDASIFLPAREDIPCVIYGPGDSEMAHQPNEFITIESLMDAVKFYCGIIENYLLL